MPEIQKRQIARKIPVADILNSGFVKEEGFEPSHISHKYGNITRVNIMGIVVENTNNEFYEGIIVDDGSGKIPARSFEKKGMFQNFEIGNVVQLIGKIREYNGERYVGCEIVRKLDSKEWLNLRKKEQQLLDKIIRTQDVMPAKKTEPAAATEEVVEISGDNSKVFSIIKQLDSGNGADVDEVLKKAKVSQGEAIIKRLLMNGDVFEIRPGRLKTLE